MGSYSHERKHLRFRHIGRRVGRKTENWLVYNGEGHQLGEVVYRPGWRRYVLRFPPHEEGNIDFDAKCLAEAIAFLDKQTAKLKATWKKAKKS